MANKYIIKFQDSNDVVFDENATQWAEFKNIMIEIRYNNDIEKGLYFIHGIECSFDDAYEHALEDEEKFYETHEERVYYTGVCKATGTNTRHIKMVKKAI